MHYNFITYNFSVDASDLIMRHQRNKTSDILCYYILIYFTYSRFDASCDSGIRRSRLNYRKCVGLGLSESQIKVFSKFNGTPLTSPSLSSSNGSTPGEMDRQFFPQVIATSLIRELLWLCIDNSLYFICVCVFLIHFLRPWSGHQATIQF